MADIILGGKTYEGIGSVRLDQTDGSTVDFVEYDTAYEDGRLAGAEEGAKSEYDRFWDAYQRNGNRRVYVCAFAGEGWNAELFRPKYDIICEGDCRRMFSDNGHDIDLIEHLNTLGIKLDTSGATNLVEMFRYNGFRRIPEINTVGCNAVNLCYYPSRLWYIENIVLRDDGSQTVDAMTQGATKLTHLRISGTIGQNAVFSANPLDRDSLYSVISHLSDTATGKSATFKLSAVNTAFETASGAADGSASEEWLALVNTKSNWTVSLV